MKDLFRSLATITQSAPDVTEAVGVGRVSAVRLGSVCDTNDPEGLRRVKALEGASGGTVATDWLWRATPAPFDDPPLVRIRQLVQILSFEDNPHFRAYAPLNSPLNAPLPKADPDNDHWRIVPGDYVYQVGRSQRIEITEDDSLEVGGDRFVIVRGDEAHRVEGNFDLRVKGNITIATDGGAKLVLTQTGNIYLECAAGYRLVLGGTSATAPGSELGMELAGGTFRFSNPADVTIDNKSVTTLGATDSRGDDLVTRGW